MFFAAGARPAATERDGVCSVCALPFFTTSHFITVIPAQAGIQKLVFFTAKISVSEKDTIKSQVMKRLVAPDGS